ncbi:MAG: MBL fold metallo-hydrolase, partial [Thaumarchaeota archaeon]|nr:MBL fold metallo-hydrolase [Nitrososphaerota archaeon]
ALENIDIALLPIDGQFTMSPREAAECFDSIRPRQAIPYHQNRSDPEEIRALLSDSQDIEVLVLPLP